MYEYKKTLLVFFLQIPLKLYFKLQLTHRCTQTGHFFPISEHFFSLFFYFQKRAGETSTFPPASSSPEYTYNTN